MWYNESGRTVGTGVRNERRFFMLHKKKILAFGEVIWDIYPEEQVIGGAPLNFAAHSAACGVKSYLLSGVGADELGIAAMEKIRDFGVKTDFVQTVQAAPTGQCLVKLNARSVPSYNVLKNVAYDGICLTEDDLAQVRAQKFDVLYFGTLIQRDMISRSALSALLEACDFEDIFCDLNLRPDCYDADSVSLCLRNATILKISDEEEPILRKMGFYHCFSDSPEAIAKAIAARYGNLKHILITCGAKGSMQYVTESGECFHQSIVKVPVVSTVGAGDSFSAAWLSAHLDGLPPTTCLRKAAELSAFVVSRREAVPKKQ